MIQNEQLGIGSGKRATYQMKNYHGLKYDTVRLYFDNERVLGDFEINSEVGRITCNAPSGVIITCDYESGWENETWHEMSLSSRESLEDYDISEFRFSRDDSDYRSVCAVRIELIPHSGSTVKESIGKGTGKTQTYRLNHKVKDGVITIYANNTAMSKNSYALLDDPQFISIACSNGSAITASYSWISEPVYVYQAAAVFSE